MAFIKKSAPQIQCTDRDERHAGRDFADLVAELGSDNETARRWAVRDLTPMPNASTPLVARLAFEQSVSVRTAILNALAQLGDQEAVSGLVNCLRSEDAGLRNEAIEVLKDIPQCVEPIINTLLTDIDSDVRIFAVNILESLRHQDVEKWLVNVIEKDEHINVCATAVDLLSEVGSEFALPALNKLKNRFSDEPYICFSVDLAVKRIKDEAN
jgi:HEAT repeat protein